jgi:hypothetical protein
MKKIVSLLAVCMATSSFAQKMLPITNLSNNDTLYVSEANVLKVVKSTTGSNLTYINQYGDLTSAAIRERSIDTGNVAATIEITFAGASGSIDSIVINGVEIMGGTVAFTSNIGTTVGLVEDSIDNTTQSPVNYSAANTGAVLTISAPAAFGDTANGYEVEVYTTTITYTFSGGEITMTDGFTAVRSLITLSDGIFNAGDGETALEASQVGVLTSTTGGGCMVSIHDKNIQKVQVTSECGTVMNKMNAHE